MTRTSQVATTTLLPSMAEAEAATVRVAAISHTLGVPPGGPQVVTTALAAGVETPP